MKPTISLPSRLSSTIAYLRDCVRIDTRSLALFRIMLGVLIIGDLLSRSRNFWFYYTDDGVVPQELAESFTPDGAFSFFYYTSDPTVIAGLFILHGLVALQLIVGYKTRFATILSFLFVISLDHHNPLVLSYADTLFRLLFFWAIFLPLGERWSIDAVHRSRSPRQGFVGLASVFALSQMVVMYTINGFNKMGSDLWQSGEAAVLVMGLDEMTFLLGDFMRNFELPLQVGGWLWFHMLLASPLLILLRGRKRLPLLVFFMGGHASFALTVRIGAFAYVALTGLLLFIPAVFYADLSNVRRWIGVAATPFNTIRSHAIAAAQAVPNLQLTHSRVQQIRTITYKSTMVVILIALGISVALLLPEASVLVESDIDEDYDPEDNIVESAVGAQIHTVAERLNIDQPPWSIFAGPGPRTTDRYYVFPAKTADGQQLDIYNDRELSFERPGQELQKQHGSYRERFYMNSIRRAGSVGEAPDHLVSHLCERAPEKYGVELTHINIYEITEQVTRDTIDDPENRSRESNLRSRHSCGDQELIHIGHPEF